MVSMFLFIYFLMNVLVAVVLITLSYKDSSLKGDAGGSGILVDGDTGQVGSWRRDWT